MRVVIGVLILGSMVLVGSTAPARQSATASNDVIVVNSGPVKWQHAAGDPPGSESIVLRQDPAAGSMELFVRYPAGYVFPPHWHSANERIVLLEGRMTIRVGNNENTLEAEGFAYLPAKETQRIACVSKTQCSFYVSWDGKADFHKAGD